MTCGLVWCGRWGGKGECGEVSVKMKSWPPGSSSGIGRVLAPRPPSGEEEPWNVPPERAPWQGPGPALNLQTWTPRSRMLGGSHLMPVQGDPSKTNEATLVLWLVSSSSSRKRACRKHWSPEPERSLWLDHV